MKRVLSFILALALVLTGNIISFAQPEIIQSPMADPGTQRLMLMKTTRDTNLYPELFLRNINTKPKIREDSYMPGTLGYGMVNLTTSWLDVPKDILQVTQEKDVVVGSTYGFGKGIVEGLVRGASGAVEVATLGLLPQDKPLFEPEYKIANPEEGLKINLLEW